MSNYRRICLYGGPGVGKCFGKGTKILMHNGSTECVENIKVGDLIMGDDSQPRTVLNTTKGFGELYDVFPKKGKTYRVNGDHILCLKISSSGKTGKDANRYKKNPNLKEDNIFEISVKEYLKLSNRLKHHLKGYRVGIDFDNKEVDIDPYFLGVWLGDGTSNAPHITSADHEVAKFIYTYAQKVMLNIVEEKQDNNAAITYKMVQTNQVGDDVVYANYLRVQGYTLKQIQNLISNTPAWKELGRMPSIGCLVNWKNINTKLKTMFGNNVLLHNTHDPKNRNFILNKLKNYKLINNKHIPDCYKFNDEKTRLHVLAGLIDSDGHNCGNDTLEFSNKNLQLANDVVFLARSLGFHASIKEAYKRATNTKGHEKQLYWRVFISGNCSRIPSRIDRKKSAERICNKDHLRTGINVHGVGRGEYFGFQVDGNNRFLLDDFTVTHNSATACYLVYRMKSEGFNVGLVHEVVKEKTYINLHPRDIDQYKIFGDQINTVMLPLNGGEDYVVEDSPIMLNTMYAEMIGTPAWELMRKVVNELDRLYSPINILINRNPDWKYKQIGRFSDEMTARKIDRLTKKMFKDENMTVHEFLAGENEEIYDFVKKQLKSQE